MISLTFKQDSALLNGERTITISSSAPAEALPEFTEEFIKPLLLAIGYSPENVNELFAEE